ncbi:MAG: GAF domain-containing protein [Anaerolineales bacterium]|nr:GAF domain-containing protein [Anaerolineales bacterium]
MLRRLRVQQTLFALFVALTPLFIVTAIIAQRSFSTLEEEAIRSQGQEARVAATEIESFIQGRENQLRLVSEVRSIGTLSQAEQQTILSGLLAYDSAYQELTLLNADGAEVVRVSRSESFAPDELGNRNTDVAFVQPRDTGEAYFSEVRFDEVVREPLITIAVPIINLTSGQASHVLVAEFRFRPIWDLIAQLKGNQTTTDVFVTDTQGRLVAHANPSLVLRETTFDLPKENGAATGLEGDEVILAREAINYGNQSLVVIAERDYSDALSLANDILRISITIVVISAIAVLIFVSLALTQLIGPIARLTKTAKVISEGNLAAAAQVSGPTEIRELAQSFNSMTGQLRDLISNLETRVNERTHDLQIAATVSTQITTLLDTNELLTEVSKQLQEGFDFYHTGVFLYDEETQHLQLAARTGRDSTAIGENFSMTLDAQGLIPKAARNREPIVANNVAVEPDYTRHPALTQTQAELTIPMVVGGNLIGVLDLQSDKQDRFGADELQVLPTLAQQIGIAIVNARSYSDAEEARQIAEESNKVKSQFLANMSHELRTPLNAILNFTGFVADGLMGEVNERQVTALNQSITSGKHLLSLINDILDITKIEAGLMDLFIQEVDMNEIISAGVSVGKGLVKDKPIKLFDEIDTDLPVTFGDKRRLRQVLLNMISNAVKFTPEGTVTVTARRADSTILITVKDTGIGIAPDDQHLVFESFKQAKHDLHDTIGTGLGMPISKFFVESHGGTIWLESEVGVGTTFFVELPILTEEQAKALSEQIAQPA